MFQERIRKKIVLKYKQGMELKENTDHCKYHIKSIHRAIRKVARKRSYKRRKGARRHQKLNQSVKTKIRNIILNNPWLSCSLSNKTSQQDL